MEKSKRGKIIAVTSCKGGVGKTITTLNLAGIYCGLNKKVLIIDLDLYTGSIATMLKVENKSNIFKAERSLWIYLFECTSWRFEKIFRY